MGIPPRAQVRQIALDYTGSGVFAGFSTRFAGAAIDAAMFFLLGFIVSHAAALLFGPNPLYRLYSHELVCILYVAYATLQIAGLQQSTLGQRIVGVYVVSEDGSKPEAQQAFARTMVQLIFIIPVTLTVREAIYYPSLLSCIFFLMSLGAWAYPFLQVNLMPEKTGLYDIVARTRVVEGRVSLEEGLQAFNRMLELKQHAASQKRIFPDYSYVGLFRRVRARFVDTFIVIGGTTIFFLAYVGNLEHIENEGAVFQYHMYLLIYACYELTFCASSWHTTPGKHLVGIEVVNANGQPLSMKESLLRYLAFLLSCLPLLVIEFGTRIPWTIPLFLILSTPFLITLFTKQKAMLHDLLVHTRVVEVNDIP